jgi:hypothetical protein
VGAVSPEPVDSHGFKAKRSFQAPVVFVLKKARQAEKATNGTARLKNMYFMRCFYLSLH